MLQNFSIDLIEQFIVGYALTLSKTCPCFYLSAVHVSNRNCRLQTLSVWKSLKFVVWGRVNYKYTHKQVMSVGISAMHLSYGHFPLSSTCATDKKYSLLIGCSRNSSLKQNSTYSIQWLTYRQEFTCVYLTYFRSACRKSWVLYRTAALCENVGARNLIGRMKDIVGHLRI